MKSTLSVIIDIPKLVSKSGEHETHGYYSDAAVTIIKSGNQLIISSEKHLKETVIFSVMKKHKTALLLLLKLFSELKGVVR